MNPDHDDIEYELGQALSHRAEQIQPTDRWEEIRMSTEATTPRRRWPVVLLAAAAVLGIVATIWLLRPQPAPQVPATPSPTATSSPTPSTSASPSTTATPPVTASPSASESAPVIEGTVPVYYIAPRALGWPESGLGLRRAWVPAETPGTPQARAKAALVLALDRPTATEGALRPWQRVGLRDVVVGADRIDVTLDRAPTADVVDPVSTLAVQQLVWTVQAAVGAGNVPVQLAIDGGGTKAWDVDLRTPFTRPANDQQYTVLTDLWITDPSYPEGGTAVVRAGQPLTVKGEACVFEANVQWQLVDGSNNIVDKGFVTASTGAPGRGTFEITVTPPAAGQYVLKAFSVSMRDGASEIANDTLSLTVR